MLTAKGGTDFRLDAGASKRLASIAAIFGREATMVDVLHFLVARESNDDEGAFARSSSFWEWKRRYR